MGFRGLIGRGQKVWSVTLYFHWMIEMTGNGRSNWMVCILLDSQCLCRKYVQHTEVTEENIYHYFVHEEYLIFMDMYRVSSP